MTYSQRRDVLKAAGAITVIGGLAGCAEDEEPVDDEDGEAPTEEPEETQEEEEPEDDVGAFRVAHASPDAPNVDVYFDEQAVIEDLGFREVSPYEEVEPGTYQVQVTATDDPDTVVFDEEVEVEGGVTNTAVAFGEAAAGPENEFTVEILEDDIEDPGEDMSRIRLFHASPDAEEVDIVVAEAPEEMEEEEEEEEPPEEEAPDEEPEEGEPDQTQQEDEPAPEEEEPEDEEMPDEGEPEDEEMPEDDEPAEEPQVGEPLFEGVGFGDSETGEIPAGDYTLEVVPAEDAPEDEDPEDEEMPDEEEPDEEDSEDEPEETQQEDDEAPEDDEPTEEPVYEFELSTESQTVYSAFAVGYVNPEDAQTEEEEAFEVVTVEDAQAGERADGGTDGNGLLTLQH